MTTKICYTKVSTNEKLFEKRTQVKNKHVLKDNVVKHILLFPDHQYNKITEN